MLTKNLYLRLQLKYALLMILLGCADLSAQYVGTTHVIPIVADGAVGDGTFYRSAFLITRMDKEATNSCSFDVNAGFPADRLSQISFDLTGVEGFRTFTNTAGGLATGFATLSCSAPVAVNTIYFFSDTSKLISLASAPSQGTFRRASLNALHDPPGNRLGIAIANPSSATANYTIEVEVAGAVIKANLTLAPQSGASKFLDEILNVPADFLIVHITSDQPIAATGLLYINNKFTSIPLSIEE